MKFRKKPVEVEARKVLIKDLLELCEWCHGEIEKDGNILMGIKIFTLEGAMMAYLGNWIVKGVREEFYPVKDDIFRETYVDVS